MAPNLLIHALEDFGDGFEFERLCNDVMSVYFPNYIPAGGIHDSGKDGLCLMDEENTRLYFKHPSEKKSELIVFQYSLQKDWKSKIKSTVHTLRDNDIPYSRLIFVTNQPVGESAKAELKIWTSQNVGKSLEILDQEFLRIYLENPQYRPWVDKYFASYLEQLRNFAGDDSVFTAVPTSERDKRRALVLLSSCVRTEEGQQIRERAINDILLGCIYATGRKQPVTQEEIIAALQKTFGSSGFLNEELIEQTLLLLVRQERIINTDEHYSLPPDEWELIDNRIALAYADDRKFYTDVVEEVNQKHSLTDEQKREVKNAVAYGIGWIFEQIGLLIAHALFQSSEENAINLIDYPDIGLLAHSAASQLSTIELQNAVGEVIKNIFANPSEFQAQYLYGIAESYVTYESFNLDPLARALDLEYARKNRLLIDTDVIVQILIGELELGKLYRKMVQATHRLNIAMYTLPQMVHEFVYKVKSSNRDFVSMGYPPRLPTEQLDNFGDVIKAYYTTTNKNSITWHQYIRSLLGTSSDSEEQEAFVERRLSADYGIEIREFEFDGTELESFAYQISTVRQKAGTYKHDDLYETDATLALLVDQLQEQDKDNSYWLLSSDATLMREWQSRIEKRPALFAPQSWYMYISQFPVGGNKPAEFSNVMISLSLSPTRPSIPRNLLILLVRLGVNLNNYSLEVLEKLSSELHRSDTWRRVIELPPDRISDDTGEELGRSLERILGSLEARSTTSYIRIESVLQEARALRRALEEVETEKAEMQARLNFFEKKEKRRKRYERQMESDKKPRPKRKKRW